MKLEDFQRSLNIEVKLSPIQIHQIDHAAHLTQSAADFTLTAVARSGHELRGLLDEGAAECWVVEVCDRFGDYGVAGATIFQTREGVLRLSDFVLSCRVLGKNVETLTLGKLAGLARERGCSMLHLRHVATKRNSPAGDFIRQLETLGAFQPETDGVSVLLPVENIEPLAAAAASSAQPSAEGERSESSPAVSLLRRRWSLRGGEEKSDLLDRIASDMRRGEEIHKIIRSRTPQPRSTRRRPYVAPRNKAEGVVCSIFAEVLKAEKVGVDDNFFDLGGHSLLATQVIARVREAFGAEGLALRALFERPTPALLAELADDPQVVRGSAGAADPITIVDRSEPLPLSFAQQRLWFLDQLQPLDPSYNIASAVRLRGRLHLPALELALSEITARHEALRTTFSVTDGQPVQVIHDPEPFNLQVKDLSHLPEDERQAEGLRLASGLARLPFDLTRGPLLRVMAVRLSARDHLLSFCIHHIVSDGWSMSLLIAEFSALYKAFSQGQPSPLPPLPVQYADFAAWQRRRLSGPLLERELDFWRAELAGAPPALDLPTDRPRPARPSGRGARYVWRMDEQLVGALRELGRRQSATLFMTLLAGWGLTLGRRARAEEVIVGTPIAGRVRVEAEGLIGFFANTLALRVGVDERESFEAMVGRVRERALGAYGHQEVPFERLVEELAPERSLARTPIFQVMFALQNVPQAAGHGVEAGGADKVEAESVELERAAVPFDLSLLLREEPGGGVEATVDYRPELWDEASVAAMMRQYRRALEWGAEHPTRELRTQPLVEGAELRVLLEDWNRAGTESCGASHLLHELFEEQARRTPAAVALVCGEREVSYEELDERADAIAKRLRRLGVGPESIVGVLLERSEVLVAALLGVLKAGGAYLPLDPEYPTGRLRLMLEDSGAKVLLTSGGLKDRVGAAEGVDVLCLDEEPSEEADEGSDGRSPSAPDTQAEGLAYLIYTSGSTGRPKGVAITHRSAAAFLRWSLSHFSPRELSRVLAATSVCFDLSVFELFAPLSCGGSALLADNALRLPELPAAETVTLINTVPSAISELVNLGPLPRSVRVVNLAGEPLPAELARRVHERAGEGARVLNLYGPSEDTTYTTWYEVPRGLRGRMLIGRPVAGTRLYVVDEYLRPVPAGMAGELYVGGAGLARGYFGRPSLTAERFIPDPFSGEAGARLYKTGDLCRYAEGGEVEYLGRLDDQVKVRGYRVELGEVEAALRGHEAVSECAAAVREGGRLVAYYVPASQPENGNGTGGAEEAEAGMVGQLRGYLRERLPEYMVPQSFVRLPALPLTPSGKINRKALPEPAAASSVRYVEPRTEAERVVCSIFAEVLKAEKVGAEDNFFDLGGHSLLATQVISRVREAFGAEGLALRAMFERPTAAGLAEAVAEVLGGADVAEQIAAVARELEGYTAEQIAALIAEHEAEEIN